MKNLPLLYWMEDIDPVLIERSDRYRASRTPYLRVALIAAAILLLLTVALSAFAVWRVDTYVQSEYPDTYDGTLLHALDIVLTQDENAISALIAEQNRNKLHTLFNTLRGVDEEQETQDEQETQEPVYKDSEGLQYSSRGDGTCAVTGLGSCRDAHVIIPPYSPDGDLVVEIDTLAFANSFGVQWCTVPEGVVTIQASAFNTCVDLERIDLPDTLDEIGTSAFKNCEKLKQITIPNSVTKIGESAFLSCKSLQSIQIPAGIKVIGVAWFQNCTGLTEVTIPESVTEIDDKAFWGCSGLTEVIIPGKIDHIGERAFDSCTGLIRVRFDNSQWLHIDHYAFSECTALSDIIFPNDMRLLGQKAFYGCVSLTEISIISADIGDQSFGKCTGLTGIYLGSEANINFNSFWGCNNVTSITVSKINEDFIAKGNCLIYADTNVLALGCRNSEIPDGVSRIMNYAFKNCDGLIEIYIPKSVKTIDTYAFEGCRDLTDIYYQGTEEEWGKVFPYADLSHVTIHFNCEREPDT